MRLDLLGYIKDNRSVFLQQIQPRFSVFLSRPGGNDDDVTSFDVLVKAGPDGLRDRDEGHPVGNVEGVAFGFVMVEIDDDNLVDGMAAGEGKGDGAADGPIPDD